MKSQELQVVKGYHAMMNSMRNVRKIREEAEMDTLTGTLITKYFNRNEEKCLAVSLIDTKGSKKNVYFSAKF